MLWTKDKIYREEPFEREADLEDAILTVAPSLFGENRLYLDAKRKIGVKGKTRNIPDGYLLDLSSAKEPRLFVVENEIAKHDPLKHIAVQILEFSLSFESTPQVVKKTVKDALSAQPDLLSRCSTYAVQHGFDNVDFLLEQMIFGANKFSALLIIDELDPELETVLISRFQFPVEVLTLQRYVGAKGERVFKFDPFLVDIVVEDDDAKKGRDSVALDPSEIDTIVVPARSDGFESVFIGENRWYKIRIHSSMIPKIKHIAVYRVAPESAITHVAPVESIKQWPDSNKYVVNFAAPARPIGPIRLRADGSVRQLQAARYTSLSKLEMAKTLDDAF